MDKNKNPLKVALHGMDERSYKMMAMYLQGPCKGVAAVVNPPNAEIDIFDADSVTGQRLLRERIDGQAARPLIVLSLNASSIEGAFRIGKPVKTEEMLNALAKARAQLEQTAKAAQPPRSSFTAGTEAPPVAEADKPVLKNYVMETDEQKKTSKHQAAMQLNEKGFGAFIGNVPGIDVNDPRQFARASYNPKEYFQGYVESAYKVSREKNQTRQLNSGWNPLIILPDNDEVWLDVDENQLRAFAGLAINSTLGSKMSVTPLSPDLADAERALDRFHSMDAFLWKVACWASKGRYPSTIDIKQPVYLKSWPNFTRLLVTPHALRIAALLVQGPRTLPDVAEVLNIKPQYVFVFISAACSLGLAAQVRREADVLVQSPEIKPNKNQGLLKRILSTLLGKKA
ncbi:hypothetical protein [Methylovulum psychrotolerans]|jgi:hypothetical protein|uniref:Uncharacterized protein n=1 Tax=Methylovulum psychrotolerans TaxID=1704499 RepID=A0A1Z4BYA7_9GAMM|nr:hypothetical protein [Methylovulum psychrotolerans]ASF46265.1 hypothetical protein CEK71_09335 [Methylovulum psychrotolerans]MBT9097024.1 hypothetical protein [Methylovulum psychrotolerans]POZ51209.1 hypothetical protein AADEFJLK_03172 [Methylovulum psychrotolerans]